MLAELKVSHPQQPLNDFPQLVDWLSQSNDSVSFEQRLNALDGLSDALISKTCPGLTEVPGVAFLAAFLRRHNIEALISRELAHIDSLNHFVDVGESKALRTLPKGIVGHWIAGNVPLLGLFSWAISAVLGNRNIIRLSNRQNDFVTPLLDLLSQISDVGQVVSNESAVVVFDRDNQDAHQAMSRSVDVRIAWGGAEAIESIRSLPTKWDCEDIAMGPRASLAVIDPSIANDRHIRQLTTDVIYFDQLACSSPQVLFVKTTDQFDDFIERFQHEFERQAKGVQRHKLDFSETYQIQLDRARISLGGGQVRRDEQTTWTLAIVDQPYPNVHCVNRFLQVVQLPNVEDVLPHIPSNVQTMVTLLDSTDFDRFTEMASKRGVCRFPSPGEGNHFELPWDGISLSNRLTRCSLRSQK